MPIEEHEITELSLRELQEYWSKAWGVPLPNRIRRPILELSLRFKLRERNGHGLTAEEQKRFNKLVTTYKRNPKYFDDGSTSLKPGVKLVRNWKGDQHVVTVTETGFDYQGHSYSSLSKIACDIAGSRWNGWVFFGLKK